LLQSLYGHRQRVPRRIEAGNPILNAFEVRLPLSVEQRRFKGLPAGDLFRQAEVELL
jgi:hypothetical protein